MISKILTIIVCSSIFIIPKNQFMGIIEDNSVMKNSFLCPLSLHGSGNVLCNNMDAQMVGFDISGGHTIQIFNNQQYWLQQKFERLHLLMARGYKGTRLDSTMTQEGWDHMGAFSIIISTDPILAEAIEPQQVAAKGQVKLIVQLWYSASSGLQLWAQDVVILDAGQNFTVLVSNNVSQLFEKSSLVTSDLPIASNSSRLEASLPVSGKSIEPSITVETSTKQVAPTTLSNFKQQFLQSIGFAPNNIDKNVYNTAFGSPRNIQIQVQ